LLTLFDLTYKNSERLAIWSYSEFDRRREAGKNLFVFF
jgi:hypothetical protein